jgi:Tfp pilus assembly protein PilN
VRAVNLLPADERRKGLEEGARKPLLVAGGGIVVVTLLATLLATFAALDASDTRSEVEAVEAAIAELPEPEVRAVDAGTLVQERTDRQSALAAALTGRVAFDKLMQQISLVLPEDAWLTQMNAALPAAAPTDTPPAARTASSSPGVTIQGATWSHERVAVVLARLAAIPTLSGVRLTGATRVEPQGSGDGEGSEGQPGKPYVTFVISADVSTGGDA